MMRRPVDHHPERSGREKPADAEIIWVSWLPLLTRRVLEQRHALAACDGEHSEVRDDEVDAGDASQGQRAALDDLCLAALARVLHGDHHAGGAGDEVHGAAHALHHFARDHPVGEIAVLGHLHGAEDRQVDMAAAHHAEGIGRREIAGRRQFGDGLLALGDVGGDELLVEFDPEARPLVHEVALAELADQPFQTHLAHVAEQILRRAGEVFAEAHTLVRTCFEYLPEQRTARAQRTLQKLFRRPKGRV